MTKYFELVSLLLEVCMEMLVWPDWEYFQVVLNFDICLYDQVFWAYITSTRGVYGNVTRLGIFPSDTKWDVRSLLTWHGPVLTPPDLTSSNMTQKYPILNFGRETLLNITRKKNTVHYWQSWILPDITKLLYCQTGMFTGWTKLCLVMRKRILCPQSPGRLWQVIQYLHPNSLYCHG